MISVDQCFFSYVFALFLVACYWLWFVNWFQFKLRSLFCLFKAGVLPSVHPASFLDFSRPLHFTPTSSSSKQLILMMFLKVTTHVPFLSLQQNLQLQVHWFKIQLLILAHKIQAQSHPTPTLSGLGWHSPLIPPLAQVQSASHSEPSTASPQVQTNLNPLENSSRLVDEALRSLPVPRPVASHLDELIALCLLAKLWGKILPITLIIATTKIDLETC